MKTKFLTLLFLASATALSAQEAATDTVRPSPNPYIESYDDYVQFRLGFSNSFNAFHIVDEPASLDFTLAPNQQLRTTLSIIYKFIEIDLGYTPEFIRFNNDDDIKGKTRFYNLGARFYFGKWMQQAQYATTKGYYVDKADIGIEENILFPDFRVKKFGGSTSYVFNPDFSFRAIFQQAEWQKQSVGSFVPGISYYFTEITNGGPSKDKIFDVALGPAYYYNLVIGDKFLVSAGAYAGIGYNVTKTTYNNDTPDEKVDGLSLQTQLRLTLGYNTTRFYTGAAASLNSFSYDNDARIHVQDRQQFLEFYLGYRFMGPKKVGELLDNPPKLKKKVKE